MGGPAWVAALALIGAAAGAQAAEQHRAPSDIELRSAYCSTFVANQIQRLAAIPRPANMDAWVKEQAAQELRDLKDTEARFAAYLEPRASQLDPRAITRARQRGAADGQELPHVTNGIIADCAKTVHGMACFDKRTAAHPLLKRLRDCENPIWLPF